MVCIIFRTTVLYFCEKVLGNNVKFKLFSFLDYNVEANFVQGQRGARILAHGGHRYCMCRQGKDYTRWICNRTGPRNDLCSALAYTKEIDGITMACLPSDDIHTHEPRYT